MDIEFLNLYQGMGYYSVEVKAKVEGKTRFIDVRVALRNLTLSIDSVGVAANKNRNYKYISNMNNEYRYLKGDERKQRVRRDILSEVPSEVLQFAINKVKEEIKIEDDWFK